MEITPLKGHSSHVNKVAVSPDARYIASAGFSGELFLWDVEREERVQVYEGHQQTVNGVCWLDDGKKILSASGDGKILIHEVSTSSPLREMQDLKSGVNHLRVTADERFFLTSTKSHLMNLWDFEEGKKVSTLKSDQKNQGVLSVALFHDHAIIGGLGKTLRRISIMEGEVLEQMEAHESAVMGFRFFDEDRHAVSVGYDGKLLIWDMVTHQPLEKFHLGDEGYYGIDVSPDGLEAAVTMPYELKRITLSDLTVQQLSLPAKGNYSVNYAQDGSYLAIGSADKTVRVVSIP
ncbi:WD40 repeat domain-containing protein [Halobacillus yeomjeoni]|uniref:WD40 repeat domain-containing protein n=1 Tax=Halobacillus yeomjeoni TaxID=311194 RepID=A0A931MW52_9BACI|nr:WD40 repeat domain-containing protein [Halobacillus yeomjeoni]MBH0231089.1 WD40 repeat domain-containing protein [Halobacillus yeomjeoni]